MRRSFGWWAKLAAVALALVLAAGVLGARAFADGPYRWGRAWGPGPFGAMMGGFRGMMGPGMMGGYGYSYPNTQKAAALTIEEAAQAVEEYLAAWGDPDLAPTEVMEFAYNFYAEVKEKSTGTHAMELLIDKDTGAVYPEMGPNMMWNTKYGHMGGMMGGFYGPPTAQMPVAPQRAEELAQRWLDRYLPGTTVEEADTFYGYYTLHTLAQGQLTGMLSVNGYTGQVWYHSWHGPFVQMKELD